LSITGAVCEECRELDYSTTAALAGRIGRYPAMTRVKPTWQGIMFVSNPWSESSDWHEHFVLNKPDGWSLYHQPGGLDPSAENVKYLPDRYYERLMEGRSQEFINVHVHSMWGDDQFGQSVYKASFNSTDHFRTTLKVNPHLPILVGIDFGRTPACVITQEDINGRVLIFEEVTSNDMGLDQFCSDLLLPVLHEHYATSRVFVVGDPAGVAKSQFSERNAYDVLREYGLECVPAPTNNIAERLRSVEKLLLSTRAGDPGFMMDDHMCPVLARGFQRDYRYRKKRDGELTPLPDKNDASHVHDALQYACLGHQSHYVGRRVMMATQQVGAARSRRRPSSRGWT